MRNIENIVDFMRFICRKQRGVMLTIPDATAALDTGQMDAFADYFALYGKDQVVHDALKPFRVYQPFTSSSAGFVTVQSDYMHLLGQPFTVYGSTVNRIVFVNEDELPFALTSQSRAVSNSYPIAVDTATGFSIYPQTTQTGAYTYLRRPATPVYAYTLSGSDSRTVTYNSAGSTQLEWNEQYINNIIAKALVYVGVNMSEAEVFNFANQYNAQTAAK
jgi:hypothetical protein